MSNNKKVSKFVNKNLKHLFVTLASKYKELCLTEATSTQIKKALNNQDTDVITSLTILAKITTQLATPKPGKQLSESEYSYQGKEELYDLLDAIRHEYRMLDLILKEKGIDVDANEATNNLAFVRIKS